MKTKTLVLSLASLLVSIISFAQEKGEDKKDNIVFLLRQTEHINQAIKTIHQLKQNTSTNLAPGKIVIIVCGEAVTSLTTKDAASWVQKMKAYTDASIIACGLSLNKFKIDKKDLIAGIGFTENGLIKSLELQKAGYLSVEL